MHAPAAGGTLRCLQKPLEKPEGTLRPTPRPAEEEDGGTLLACAHCLREVTTSAARIAVGGGHEHTFTNPAGFRYHIGCFATVVGCVRVGEPSTYWTWFPGSSWQIEQCGTCREHLGWLFRSADSVFHGLIVDRLVEIEEGS